MAQSAKAEVEPSVSDSQCVSWQCRKEGLKSWRSWKKSGQDYHLVDFELTSAQKN